MNVKKAIKKAYNFVCKCCIKNKISDRLIKRDYDKDTLSSKFDVLLQPLEEDSSGGIGGGLNNSNSESKKYKNINLNLQ